MRVWQKYSNFKFFFSQNIQTTRSRSILATSETEANKDFVEDPLIYCNILMCHLIHSFISFHRDLHTFHINKL